MPADTDFQKETLWQVVTVDTAQQWVQFGALYISAPYDVDGAGPYTANTWTSLTPTSELIGSRKAIATAGRVGAALLAAPVKATIKRIGPDGLVQETIPRDRLWAAQTPQVFERQLILRAYQEALRAGFSATDDAQLVERLGHPVAIVESTDENLKITTPEDLLVAEGLLKRQR